MSHQSRANPQERESRHNKDSHHASAIDPKLYQHPNADKEVLNLVDSQFGKGFLELNFDDDDEQAAHHKKDSKKPVSNPHAGNKKQEPKFEFDFNEPKSAKHSKPHQGKQF